MAGPAPLSTVLGAARGQLWVRPTSAGSGLSDARQHLCHQGAPPRERGRALCGPGPASGPTFVPLSSPSAWMAQGQPSFCRPSETMRTSTPGSGVPTEPAEGRQAGGRRQELLERVHLWVCQRAVRTWPGASAGRAARGLEGREHRFQQGCRGREAAAAGPPHLPSRGVLAPELDTGIPTRGQVRPGTATAGPVVSLRRREGQVRPWLGCEVAAAAACARPRFPLCGRQSPPRMRPQGPRAPDSLRPPSTGRHSRASLLQPSPAGQQRLASGHLPHMDWHVAGSRAGDSSGTGTGCEATAQIRHSEFTE